MERTAQRVLKQALEEQMEKEAAGVPSTKEIQQIHKFSDSFLKYMRRLIRQESEKGKKEKRIFIYRRLAAACAIGILVIFAGNLCVNELFRAGSSAPADTAMDQAESTESAVWEESPQEDIETSGNVEDSGAAGNVSGYMPFEDISIQDITSVQVSLPKTEQEDKQQAEFGDDAIRYADQEWKQKLAQLLCQVVLYEEIPLDFQDEAQVTYQIEKTDGTEVVVSVYPSAMIVDGVGYQADEDICGQLILLVQEKQ